MKHSISKKQIEANRKNAKKGGVKTPEGKEISKYNSLKHGILSVVITEYDKGNFEELHKRLIGDLCPETVIEEILVERIALYFIRLNRGAKAETEYIKKILNPDVGHWEVFDPIYEEVFKKWIVDKEGYRPKINKDDIEPLVNLYLRYEKSLENRLFKTMHELMLIQRARKENNLPLQMSLDTETESS
jgi:hypothetical protein